MITRRRKTQLQHPPLIPSNRFCLLVLLPLLIYLLRQQSDAAADANSEKQDIDDGEELFDDGIEFSDVYCTMGWAGGLEQQEKINIPKYWINDGYCDCPFDGNDEPNTNACSGSLSWPGVDTPVKMIAVAKMESSDDESSEEEEGSAEKEPQSIESFLPPNDKIIDGYVCPQQPKLKLPLSRMNDGICDCCDGSDEIKGVCNDICDAVLKEERERQAKIKSDYLIGSRKRDLDVTNFHKLRETKSNEINVHEKNIQQLKLNVDTINTEIRNLKLTYVQKRIMTMKNDVVAKSGGMDLFPPEIIVNPNSNEDNNKRNKKKLENFIIHACQVSGELLMIDEEYENTIPDDDEHEDTCTPLRVAAMDLGFSWKVNHENDYNTTTKAIHDNNNRLNSVNAKVDMTTDMVQIIFDNALDTADRVGADEGDADTSSPSLPLLRWTNSKKNKKKNTRKGGRRLSEADEEDDGEDDASSPTGWDDDGINDYRDDEPIMDDDYVPPSDEEDYEDRTMVHDDDDIINHEVDDDSHDDNDKRRRRRKRRRKPSTMPSLMKNKLASASSSAIIANDDEDSVAAAAAAKKMREDAMKLRSDIDSAMKNSGIDDDHPHAAAYQKAKDMLNKDIAHSSYAAETVIEDEEKDDDDDDIQWDLLEEVLETTSFSEITQRYNFIEQSERIINAITKLLEEERKKREEKEEEEERRRKLEEEEEEERRKLEEEEEERENGDDGGDDANEGEEDSSSTTTKKDEEEEEDGSNKDGSSNDDHDDNKLFDSTAYTMVQNSLRKKEEIIIKGLQWGSSAKFLFESLAAEKKAAAKQTETEEETTTTSSKTFESFTYDDLTRLAIGTIFYGQIDSLHVWQILVSIMYGDDDDDENNNNSNRNQNQNQNQNDEIKNTCSSPWSEYCPPKQVTIEVSSERGGAGDNDGRLLYYPPSFLVDVAKTFCDEEAVKFSTKATTHDNNDLSSSCGGNPLALLSGDDDDVLSSFVSNYNEETFHNFGYSVPVRRNIETDPLRSMFKPIIDLSVDSSKLNELNESKTQNEKEIKDGNSAVTKLWKEIGGKNGEDLGRYGELFTIMDKCFDIVAGKYTYEVCLFGKAQQKEGGNKHGTNLGQWKGIEYEEEDETTADDENDDGPAGSKKILRRVMKWENGAKCWNGPKRSATVYMKCGPEHKIISADEPDTCRYVFEMETYLACDDDYKERIGL